MPLLYSCSCAFCGTPDATSMCSGCKKLAYCNRECQRLHWKSEHKPECKLLASLENPCPRCRKREDFVDEPGMCAACGTFKWCGTCNFELEEEAFEPCEECTKSPPSYTGGTQEHLGLLLEHKPKGRHVLYARYIKARNDACQAGDVSKQRLKAAKEELTTLAYEEEYAPAQFFLSCLHEDVDFYNYGSGRSRRVFPVNDSKVHDLLERAAAQGFTKAMMELGTCYKNGTRVPVDYFKAAELLDKAAKNGDYKAMVNIAPILVNGLGGVPQNLNKAIRYLREAANRYNNGNAAFTLFQLSCNEELRNRIPLEEGFKMLEKSARLGFPPAMPVYQQYRADMAS